MGRGPISVEPATFDGAKTAETGVNVSIDVNSRPHPVKALPLRDLQNVIDEHRRATESLHHDLNLEGVL